MAFYVLMFMIGMVTGGAVIIVIHTLHRRKVDKLVAEINEL